MKGVLPLLRLSVRLDGSLTCVPMVLGVRGVALLTLGAAWGAWGASGLRVQHRSKNPEIRAGKRREGNALGKLPKAADGEKEAEQGQCPGRGGNEPPFPSGWEGGGLRTSEVSLSTGFGCDTPYCAGQ